MLLSLQPEDKYTWLGAITTAHDAAQHERTTTKGRMCADLRNYLQTGQCQPTKTDSNHTHHNKDKANNNNNNDDDDDDDTQENDENNAEDDEASQVADND